VLAVITSITPAASSCSETLPWIQPLIAMLSLYERRHTDQHCAQQHQPLLCGHLPPTLKGRATLSEKSEVCVRYSCAAAGRTPVMAAATVDNPSVTAQPRLPSSSQRGKVMNLFATNFKAD
jgi:hypothetical protein